MQSALKGAADLSNQLTQKMWTETFANLDLWTITGTPAEGTATVANNVMTINKTGTGAAMRVSTGINTWVQPLKPFVIEMILSGSTGNVWQVVLGPHTGTVDISQLTFNTAVITHKVSGGDVNTVTPTKWTQNKKFRLLYHINPKNKTVQVYLFYEDTDGIERGVRLEAARTYTDDYPVNIGMYIPSVATGTITMEDIKVYELWAVSIGDSLSTGYPYYCPARAMIDSGYNINACYQYWIEQRLNNARRVLNMGRGGDSTRELILKYQSMVIDLAPELAIYWIGTNDIYSYPNDIATAKSNLITILTATVAAGIRTVMVNCAPRNNFTEAQDVQAIEWNTWLKTICPKLNVHLANVYDVLGDITDPTQQFALYNPDDVHWNAYGYKMAAEKIFEAITSFEV